ncbi:uncharacterized protein LOC114665064 [Erpetoichthys calabaricus]|uniref:uncharacterized protein LOC114665064 n=1 Tax=Erpetoichthys calabaricus TaxID=27687 RepID=UPI00223456CE|nr:uncharacterized protein LOC114665064 [Erpetoichthys calabaricus]
MKGSRRDDVIVGVQFDFKLEKQIPAGKREKHKAFIYCNNWMDVITEMCDTNIMERWTAGVKQEDCEWEFDHLKQQSLDIKDEECELGSVDIKAEAEENSVIIEEHKNKSVESVKEGYLHHRCKDRAMTGLVSSESRPCSSGNVMSESLQSVTGGIEEHSSVGTQKDDTPPTKQSDKAPHLHRSRQPAIFRPSSALLSSGCNMAKRRLQASVFIIPSGTN